MAPMSSLPFRCPHCPFEATSQDAFRAHAWNGHLSLRKSDEDAKYFFSLIYICSECSISSTEVDLVKLHAKTEHPDKKPSVLTHSMRIDIDENIVDDPYSPDKNEVDQDSMSMECDNVNSNTLRGDKLMTINPQVNQDRFNCSPNAINNGTSGDSFFGFQRRASSAFSTSSSGSNVSNSPGEQNTIPSSMGKSNTANNSNSISEFITSPKSTGMTVHSSSSKHPLANATSGSIGEGSGFSSGFKSQDWSKIIARSEKKFVCLLCRQNLYNGRTEVVFHAVTRHLLKTEITNDLCNYGCLSGRVKRVIGRLFVDGMRIRSGVHYKDAERVEAALFRSIELHLRYRDANAPDCEVPANWRFENLSDDEKRVFKRVYTCTGCQAKMPDSHLAFAHINDELRTSLPEFMRARSCPWSLSSREEWVWTVPDYGMEKLDEYQQQVFIPQNSSSGMSIQIDDVHVDPLPSPIPSSFDETSSNHSNFRQASRHRNQVHSIGLNQSSNKREFNSEDLNQPPLPSNLRDFYRSLLNIMAGGLQNGQNNLLGSTPSNDNSSKMDIAHNLLVGGQLNMPFDNKVNPLNLFNPSNGHGMAEPLQPQIQSQMQDNLHQSLNDSFNFNMPPPNSIALALAALNKLMPNTGVAPGSRPFPVSSTSQPCGFNASNESSSLAR